MELASRAPAAAGSPGQRARRTIGVPRSPVLRVFPGGFPDPSGSRAPQSIALRHARGVSAAPRARAARGPRRCRSADAEVRQDIPAGRLQRLRARREHAQRRDEGVVDDSALDARRGHLDGSGRGQHERGKRSGRRCVATACDRRTGSVRALDGQWDHGESRAEERQARCLCADREAALGEPGQDRPQGTRRFTRLRELSRIHMTLVRDVVRVQSRIKSPYRGHAERGCAW